MKHYLNIENDFTEDRINISMNDFVTLQEKFECWRRKRKTFSKKKKIFRYQSQNFYKFPYIKKEMNK